MELQEELLKRFVDGSLNELLHQVSLGRKGKKILYREHAPTRLKLDKNGNILIVIERSKMPFDLFWGIPKKTHRYCWDYPLWLRAKTYADIFLHAYYLDMVENTGHPNGDMTLVFKIPFFESSYRRIFDLKTGEISGMTTTTRTAYYSNKSSVEDSNPFFGYERQRDYLKINLPKVISIGLRHDHDTRQNELALIPQRAKLSSLEYSRAFLSSLSFIEGKRVGWSYYTISNNKNIVTRYFSKIEDTEPFFPPVRSQLYGTKPVLERAIKFFLTKQSSKILKALSTCWGNIPDFTTKCLIACVAVESVSDFILSMHSVKLPKEGDYKKLKKLVLKTLSKDEAIGKNPHYSRIAAIIENSRLKQPENIATAGKLVGVQISEQEISDWTKLRHPLSHGNYYKPFTLDDGTVSLNHSKLSSVGNILNKLILGIISYKGKYTNYTSPQLLDEILKID